MGALELLHILLNLMNKHDETEHAFFQIVEFLILLYHFIYNVFFHL